MPKRGYIIQLGGAAVAETDPAFCSTAAGGDWRAAEARRDGGSPTIKVGGAADETRGQGPEYKTYPLVVVRGLFLL